MSAPRYPDPTSYILGITHDIWEDRGISLLETAYAPEMIMRNAGGMKIGNGAVINDTLAKMAAFPDLEILGEDVIWAGDPQGRYLSSHRSVITGTHSGHGVWGPPTGRRFTVRCIADCSVLDEVIDDEWLAYDTGDQARQLGHDPSDYARARILAEGGPDAAARPFTPDQDRPGPYLARGNDSEWGQRLADILTRIMSKNISAIRAEYDRAIRIEHAGGIGGWGWQNAEAIWMRLRSAFPSAEFRIHHVIGRSDPAQPHRAAIRWSLDGRHDGFGRFGDPSGAPVHVMGFTHAEFGPWGLRREFTLFDEVAIWKQIHLHTGVF